MPALGIARPASNTLAIAHHPLVLGRRLGRPFWAERRSRIRLGRGRIRRILDEGLPQEPYTPDIFTAKVQLVFDHVLTAYGDNGESAYEPRADIHFTPKVDVDVTGPVDVNQITDDVVARILADPRFAAQVAEQLRTSPGNT